MVGRGIYGNFVAVLAVIVLTAASARADLVLNATGIADGFSATNFATGLPSTGGSFGQGPFGLTVVGNGSGGANVLLEDFANATLYVFNDVNGQTPGSALVTHAFQSSAEDYATLNGVGYGANGSVYGKFSSTGVFTPFSIAGLPGPGFGMAADAVTGELITVSQAGLIAINPTTNTFRVINPAVNAASIYDGVAISPDGQTAYVAQFDQNVLGYNVLTGATVFTGPKPAGSYFPDGTGVISSSNALNGDIVVNDNSGNLYLINPVADTITLIGTNANERGDFTSPDFSNGTLLLDYSDEVERLSCGPNCSIGGPAPVPEPSSIILFGSCLLAVAALAKRKLFS